MSKTGHARFTRCVALLLCFAMLPVLNGCGKKPAESSMRADSVEEVITQLATQSSVYGFNNALSELTEQSTADINGDSYYRLQQNHNGLPVYGKTLVCVTDESGNVMSLTGNVQDIQETINLNPTVTKDEVQIVFSEYAKESIGHDAIESVSLQFSNEDDLCIFIKDGPDGAVLAYTAIATVIEGDASYPYEIVFDAHTGQILSCYSAVYTDFVVMTLEGPGGVDMVVDITEETDEDGQTYYSMVDERRRIKIHSANGATLQYELYNFEDELVVDRDGNVIIADEEAWDVYPVWISEKGITEPISYSDPPEFEPEAVKLLSNLQTTYDYYEEVLGISGFDGRSSKVKIHGIYNNDLNGDSTNAYCWGYAGLQMYDLLLTFGSDNSISLDTVAHEYTHAIERKRSRMEYAGESGAIMEALSDIYGELAEGWAKKQDPDWIHSKSRNIKDPSKSKLPEAYRGKHWVNTEDTSKTNDYGGVHYNNTVISYAAYLMWAGINENESGRLNTEELAMLWYRAMLMMPSDCDFILCRQLVEVAAQSMEDLTDAQRTCIREAFDRVGIPSTREDAFHPDYRLNKDATLTVYDQNNEPYSGYTLQINGTIDMSEIASNMTPDIGWVVNRTNTVEESGAYELDLPQGCYMLTITDRYNEESYTIYVEINDDHSETNINLITAYEEPLVVVIPELDYENLVTDAYQDAFVDDDGFDYCYHIPQFNLRGNWAQQINKTIYDQCYALLKEEVYAGMDEYGYPYLEDMVYCWGYHEDFASVVIETNMTMYADTEYMVFTISTSTGKEISTDELLASYGMNQEEFYAIVRNRLKQYWDEKRDIRNDVGPEFFDDRVTNTLADSNIRDVIPFINQAGGLSFVANIYSLAAGDSYLHLINAEGTLQMEYLECSKDHSKDTAEPTGDVLQYFIEYCDKLYFTEEDVQTFDDEMCMYARNAIFAKSGRKFQSQSLQDYFGKYSWYMPSVEADAFSEDLLNRKQLANLAAIQAREETLEIESLMASLDGEAGIYTRYLHNGGYDELLDSEYDKNTLEVSSSLADFDNDGTKELFLSFETGQSGIRGMENYTYLLDIEANQVSVVSSAYFGGGSMGGDHLAIKFDRDTQSHVVVMEGYTRDGVEAYIDYMEVYSKPDFKVGKEFFNTYYSLYNNWYGDYVDKVRSETTLYYENEYDFRFYKIDGQYVTEEAFNNALARYEEPKDGYAPKVRTYATPIS